MSDVTHHLFEGLVILQNKAVFYIIDIYSCTSNNKMITYGYTSKLNVGHKNKVK